MYVRMTHEKIIYVYVIKSYQKVWQLWYDKKNDINILNFTIPI